MLTIRAAAGGGSAMAAVAGAAAAGGGVSTMSADPRRYSFYSPEMTLLAETEHPTAATPPVQYEYVWFGGVPVAQLSYSVLSSPLAATEVVWTVTDHLGTPKLQTDANQQIVWHSEHEPYGQIYVLRAGEGRHQPLRFPGQEAEQLGVDSANGVSERSYNIMRWYRAEAGRYTQRDRLGLAGGSNLYRYATANPVRYLDRLGLVPGIQQTEIPDSSTPFGGDQPAYNCLAWGLGVSDHWIQPCDESGSPNAVPPNFGCKEISCDAKVPCGRTKVIIFEDSQDPQNWHVMKQQCGKGWSSKNGQGPLYVGITTVGGETGPAAAEIFYNEYYKPKGAFEIKCWDCPSGPGPINKKPCY